MRLLTSPLSAVVLLFSSASLCSDSAGPALDQVAAATLAEARRPPAISSATVAVRRQASRLWIVGSWTASGSPDSILSRHVHPSDTVVHRLKGTVTRDSFVVPAPAPGDSTSGVWMLRAKRRGLLSEWASRGWKYVAPDSAPPVPVMDSLIVLPDSVSVMGRVNDTDPAGPEHQQQFCHYWRFTTGHVAHQVNRPAYCDSLYLATWPDTVRAVTPAEQQVADTACVRWSAEGGTITASPCQGTPA